MGSPTTIHPFPELRALAEEEARAFAGAWAGASHSSWQEWNVLNPETRDRRILAHLTLLCDLSRPASRDAVCRLVAVRLERSVISVMWALEDTGPSRSGLMLDAGCSDGWLLPPAEALSLIVRHLWPEDSTDAR